jgi:hypothetical protein
VRPVKSVSPPFSPLAIFSGLLLWDCQSLLDLLERRSKAPLRRSLSGRSSGIVLASDSCSRIFALRPQASPASTCFTLSPSVLG